MAGSIAAIFTGVTSAPKARCFQRRKQKPPPDDNTDFADDNVDFADDDVGENDHVDDVDDTNDD